MSVERGESRPESQLLLIQNSIRAMATSRVDRPTVAFTFGMANRIRPDIVSLFPSQERKDQNQPMGRAEVHGRTLRVIFHPQEGQQGPEGDMYLQINPHGLIDQYGNMPQEEALSILQRLSDFFTGEQARAHLIPRNSANTNTYYEINDIILHAIAVTEGIRLPELRRQFRRRLTEPAYPEQLPAPKPTATPTLPTEILPIPPNIANPPEIRIPATEFLSEVGLMATVMAEPARLTLTSRPVTTPTSGEEFYPILKDNQATPVGIRTKRISPHGKPSMADYARIELTEQIAVGEHVLVVIDLEHANHRLAAYGLDGKPWFTMNFSAMHPGSTTDPRITPAAEVAARDQLLSIGRSAVTLAGEDQKLHIPGNPPVAIVPGTTLY